MRVAATCQVSAFAALHNRPSAGALAILISAAYFWRTELWTPKPKIVICLGETSGPSSKQIKAWWIFWTGPHSPCKSSKRWKALSDFYERSNRNYLDILIARSLQFSRRGPVAFGELGEAASVRWVGGFGWKPSRPCVRQIRAQREPRAAAGWMADAHHRMHQVFMILSKKCFDRAVCAWLVCLFKYFFFQMDSSAHAHTEWTNNHWQLY